MKSIGIGIFVLIFFGFSIFAVPLTQNSAYGLSCAEPNTIKTIEFSDAVFSGTAISKEYLEPPDEQHLEAITSFSISEMFKGSHQDTVKIFSNEMFWGYNFTVGEKYVVFASAHESNDSLYLTPPLCEPVYTGLKSNIDLIQKVSKGFILPPIKQLKLMSPNYEIQCNESLELITKNNGSPACVKPSTAEKLIERGWVQ